MATPLLLLLALPLSAQDLLRIPGASKTITEGETGIALTLTVAPFLLGKTEVTQAEYQAVTGQNPSLYPHPDKPVENVSWWDAIRYCNLRSLRENLTPVYDLTTGRADRTRNGYRLPSDAEWETAAGDAKPPQDANLGIASTKDARALIPLVKDKGTRAATSGAPNKHGLFNLHGNVWEWTDDFFNPTPNAPQSNGYGVARIIRGGSFVSTVSGWARGYRSSMPPEHRSRFTGFRVARTLNVAPVTPDKPDWHTTYWQPPAGFENGIGDLKPLTPPGATQSQWTATRAQLVEKWRSILGQPDLPIPTPRTRLLDTFNEPLYRGELRELQTEPDSWEKILILTPHSLGNKPAPVVIVPYYDVDTPAGRNLGGRSFMTGGVRAYAQLAAQRGMIAVAIRWFGESYGERYDEAVVNLALRHPNCTGLGKWVWDAQRLVDYIHTLPSADPKRIGIIGHSLGSKMAVYAAAMDPRINTVVASEGGIGFKMSNYEDYWYLGHKLAEIDKNTDQQELLGLVAPRPFLLIGGDEYDGPQSWRYIHAAKAVYDLYGKPRQIGYFNHHKGHSPTPEAIALAMRWLERFLGPAI